MNTIETKRSPRSPDLAINEQKVIEFMLSNLPDRRFLLRQDEKKLLPFKIGQQEWELRVENDQRGTPGLDLEPVRIITLSTSLPKTNQRCVLGLMTDPKIEKIIGVYERFGNSRIEYGISPLDFKKVTMSLRDEERRRVLRSLRQTHSLPRTSQKQGLSHQRVWADVRYFKRHGLPVTFAH